MGKKRGINLAHGFLNYVSEKVITRKNPPYDIEKIKYVYIAC